MLLHMFLFRCDKTQVNSLYPFQNAYPGQNISSFFPVLFKASGGLWRVRYAGIQSLAPMVRLHFYIKVKPLVYTRKLAVLRSLILCLILSVWCGTPEDSTAE